jgi:hypothetical protein
MAISMPLEYELPLLSEQVLLRNNSGLDLTVADRRMGDRAERQRTYRDRYCRAGCDL